MKNKEITFNIKIAPIIILLIGVIGMSVFSYFLIKNSLNNDYPQIIGLALGLVFGFLAIGGIITIFSLESITLKNNELLIKSFNGSLKKTIKLSEIKGYYEIEKHTKNSKWKDLTILTKQSKYTISSHSHPKYDTLKNIVTKGKKRDKNAERIWHSKMNRRLGIGLIMFGLLLLSFFGRIYFDRNEIIQTNELSQINGTVAFELKLKQSIGKKRKIKRWLEVRLKEYPDYTFKLAGFGFKATNVFQLISDIKINESIKISILTHQLKKKLTKESPMSFWDKSMNNQMIGIYGLQNNQNNYFNLSEYNRMRIENKNSWGIYIFLCFSIFMTGYGVYLLNKK